MTHLNPAAINPFSKVIVQPALESARTALKKADYSRVFDIIGAISPLYFSNPGSAMQKYHKYHQSVAMEYGYDASSYFLKLAIVVFNAVEAIEKEACEIRESLENKREGAATLQERIKKIYDDRLSDLIIGNDPNNEYSLEDIKLSVFIASRREASPCPLR
jgi:hypothetical protein